jgi:tRNA-2-methylthio-N6-dimethylallyladenosine synthase
VPFTRGRERSRDPYTIVEECRQLVAQGYKEVTLLGQNVDSYRWNVDSRGEVKDAALPVTDFADLLALVAEIAPTLRVRYSTSHPKDMTDKVLEVMARFSNICEYIHLPVQSGSSAVLQRMNRGYDRAWYLDRIAAIRKYMPDAAISTDLISGFCGETEEEHAETISLMTEVGYDMAYMFKYSERPKTLAARKYADDVPDEVKGRRLAQIIDLQIKQAGERNQRHVGRVQEVLVEGVSKRSDAHMFGRNTHNAVVILPREVDASLVVHRAWSGTFPSNNEQRTTELQAGDYVMARILSATGGSLKGEVVEVKKGRSAMADV